jgi:hypothetical protein
LTVLSSNAPSALFEPLKQRQHNDSQPTVILWDLLFKPSLQGSGHTTSRPIRPSSLIEYSK